MTRCIDKFYELKREASVADRCFSARCALETPPPQLVSLRIEKAGGSSKGRAPAVFVERTHNDYLWAAHIGHFFHFHTADGPKTEWTTHLIQFLINGHITNTKSKRTIQISTIF